MSNTYTHPIVDWLLGGIIGCVIGFLVFIGGYTFWLLSPH